jgi:hypothetical protein
LKSNEKQKNTTPEQLQNLIGKSYEQRQNRHKTHIDYRVLS